MKSKSGTSGGGLSRAALFSKLLLILIGLTSFLLLWPTAKAAAAREIITFLWLAGAQAALCFGGALLIWKGATSAATFWIIFGIGALLRLGVVGETPELSSDIYRYVWDGRVQAAGINPYRYVPRDPHLAFLRDSAIYPHINRHHYAPTIYPPGAQIFYFVATRVAKTVVGFKAILLGVDLLTIWLLARLLSSFKLPRERVLIYAWNPLVIWEFCSGHIDFVMTIFVLLALLARRRERDTLTGVLLACATLIKFLPLAIFPALYRRGDRRMPFAFFITVCAGYLPYLSVGRRVLGFLPAYTGEEGMGEGRFFLLLLARYLSGDLPIPVVAYFVLAGVTLLLLASRAVAHWNLTERGYLLSAGILGTTFLVFLSPQYPWYWVWLTPLLAFLPAWALLPSFYLSFAALFQYTGWSFFNRDLLQFLPPAVALLAIYWTRKSSRGPEGLPPRG